MVSALSIRNATTKRRMSCAVAAWTVDLTASRIRGVAWCASFVSSPTFVEACDRLDSLMDMVWPPVEQQLELSASKMLRARGVLWLVRRVHSWATSQPLSRGKSIHNPHFPLPIGPVPALAFAPRANSGFEPPSPAAIAHRDTTPSVREILRMHLHLEV